MTEEDKGKEDKERKNKGSIKIKQFFDPTVLFEKEQKVTPTIGVFAGILTVNGELLLRRRVETDSIVPGKSFKGNWELPGGGVMKGETFEATNETVIQKALAREVKEEVGLEIEMTSMPAMYPAILARKYTEKEIVDFAFVVIIQPDQWKGRLKEETMWVSPEKLYKLAMEFEPADRKTGKDGKGIVSGYGKRMHRMALMSLSHSPNKRYSFEARDELVAIHFDM